VSPTSSVEILVQHHPAREWELARLLASLRPTVPRVVLDPDPDAPKRSAWRTYRRCLETVQSDFTVILQDDTVACPGFRQAARAANRARPGRLIAFFHGMSMPRDVIRMYDAAAHAEPLYELQRWKWAPTVALGWPREQALAFLEWIETRDVSPTRVTDDPLVGAWASAADETILATVPSLVQHPDDTVTIVGSHRGNGSGARTAGCWIGDTPVEKWVALL
jgi:hypothetical protein